MSGAFHPRTGSARGRPGLLAAVFLAAVGGCASIGPVDPLRDDGSAGFAAACAGVLAAERGAQERGGAGFTVEGHRALNEWMFQASRRSSPIDDEIGRAAERRRWAETLSPGARQARARICIDAAPT